MPAPLRTRRSAVPSLSTIAEEEEGQRSCKRRRKGGGSDSLLRSDEKSSWSRAESSVSGQYTCTIPSPTETHVIARPEPLMQKIDERQRLARERREELEKQNAARSSKWLEREERARQFHERQLEERKKKLEEQRVKEERRRAAVEEKRRQKLEEEKNRNEAAIRRTMERSQRARPNSSRWSWGGTLSASTSHNSGFDDSALFPLDLAGLEHYHGVFSVARQQQCCSKYADRRSVSTMNLSKHTDPVISKRLSSSSATLLSSPDRALQKQTSLSSSCLIKKPLSKPQISREKIPQDKPAGVRRMPLTPWENTVITRLQTPTHSYLARSRSAVSLSGEAVTPVCPRSASCHPASSMSFKSIQSRSAERPNKAGLSFGRPIKAGFIPPPDDYARRKTTQNILIDRKDKDYVRKSWSNLSYPTPSLSLFTPKRSPSPVNPSPNRGSTAKPSQKMPNPKKSWSPPPPASIPLSPSNPSLLPGNLRPIRVTPERPRVTSGKKEDVEPAKIEPEAPVSKPELPVEASGSSPSARPSAGTTDPEEASRLLTEKRRQAREQREREEEEKRQQEEAERRSREEMARRKAEERAKREEEAQRQAEEKKRREEEEKQLEEERVQREREEAERLQRQKEEEEARQRDETERLRLEREKHFQREEAERMERKKRLEEIMKRTRRTLHRNGDVSQQSGRDSGISVFSSPSVSVSTPPAPGVSEAVHSDRNGHSDPSFITPMLPTSPHSVASQPRANGAVTEAIEEVIELPLANKLSRQDGDGEEVEKEEEKRKVPLLAFSENGGTHNMSGLEENPAQ